MGERSERIELKHFERKVDVGMEKVKLIVVCVDVVSP